MSHFEYKDGRLHVENVPLARIAEQAGTPSYVYSLAAIREAYAGYVSGFGDRTHLVCYSVKANGNLAVLRALANEGAGFDVVSGGELHRVLAAGGDPGKVVFSGVGKQPWEIRMALEAGILMFNVESPAELDTIDCVGREMNTRAPVALRVNPDVDPKTHPYISTGLKTSKFGIPLERCFEDYQRAATMKGLEIVGADCHIGSQLTTTEPFVEAVGRMTRFVDRLADSGIEIRLLDMGGGLGICYQDETPPSTDTYAAVLGDALGGRDLTLIVEPGRSIVGNAGCLVTRVLYHKGNNQKNFIVVDAAMNDLARPSLYSAFHEILAESEATQSVVADVVGPVCESGDFFAKERAVANVGPGGLLVVMSAGAYGFAMASNYNARTKPAEVLVDGDVFHIVRERETLEQLIQGETIPESLG